MLGNRSTAGWTRMLRWRHDKDVSDAELRAYVLDLHRLSLVSERRIARDDEEVAKSGQVADNVSGQAIGEILLLGISGEIFEGQYGK